MARSPIEVAIASETRAFRQGVESGIIDPLEDAEKALEQLGRANGPEQLERDLKDAQRQTEKLGDETKQTARQIEREFKDAYRETSSSASDNMGRARAATQEVTSEIGQNLGEAVSSVRGNLSDLGQVGQDTLGGLAASVAGMGPAGLLGAFALAAGATGLGLFTAGLEDAEAKQEALNERAAQFAGGFIEGVNGALSAAYTFAEINAIATDPERYQEAKDAAKEWGVDVRTAMGALAGDATSLAVAQQSLADRTAAAQDALARQEQQVDSNAGAAYDLADSTKAGADRMDMLTQALALGKEQADNAAGALYNYATTVGDATERTDELGNKIYRLPDGKEVVVDANTGRAYEQIDAIEKQKIADKTVRVTVDSSAYEAFRRRALEPLGIRLNVAPPAPAGIRKDWQ